MILLQWMQGNIYRDVFPTFLTKKYYGWWITRRKMEIHTKISEEKYPKVSVTNIGVLQEPFRKRKWCLRDFAGTQEGLRNHFAATSYPRRAAKLASTLRFSASSLRHISGNFRRKSTTLCKKAAKFSQQKVAKFLQQKADSATLCKMLPSA